MKRIYNIGVIIVLLAGLCSPARGVEMNDEQLFRPFDANSHPMTTLPVAPAPAVAPTTPTTGDGYYSRQLLFAPDLDNPEGKTPMGSHMPAGEMPWWFMLIGAAALGMRRKRRELKAKN